jgi:ribose 5-phosphate isomerase A
VISGSHEFSPARAATATAALELIEPGMTIGLGSGRAVWMLMEAIGGKWAKPPIRAVVASQVTYGLAHLARIDVVPLDGEITLDLAIDGADEIDPQLRLIKGGGGALLREKIVISAANRFVVVAETDKLVDRLGTRFRLPVEVVRFGWQNTQRRLAELLPDTIRRSDGPDAYLTDEGHYILDAHLSEGDDLDALDLQINDVPGVVEHGLFIGMAERAILGRPDGTVDVVEQAARPAAS